MYRNGNFSPQFSILGAKINRILGKVPSQNTKRKFYMIVNPLLHHIAATVLLPHELSNGFNNLNTLVIRIDFPIFNFIVVIL